MISVIVSSYQTSNYNEFFKSLSETIGEEFEVIKIDNNKKMSLSRAYNVGAAKAKYPYLLFVHEDVRFNTNNWGKNLINHFTNDKTIGLIGIAGSCYKSFVPSGLGSTWGNAGLRMNILQPVNGKIKHFVKKSSVGMIENVAVIDGCFMCTTKKVFEHIQFDEINFKNYHCYDIDFSLSASLKYTVAVVYDILIEHLSTGGFNKSWLTETFKLHKKWKTILPYSISQLSKQDAYMQEAGPYYFFLAQVIKLKTGVGYFLKINFSAKFIQLVGFKNWLWMQVKLPFNIANMLFKKPLHIN